MSEGSIPFQEEAHAGGRPAWVEVLATLLIAVAAILTAWAAFQHARWSGTQASEFRQAASAGTQATQATTVASMARIVDVGVFLQWLQAVQDDIDKGLANPNAGPYVANPQTLSGFISSRFRDEFRPAFDAWIATRPLQSTNGATTPFELPQYSPAADRAVLRLNQAAEEHGNAAQDAIHRGEQYVLLTTLFAVALVLASIGSKLRGLTGSLLMLGTAGIIVAGATVALIAFQVEA